MLDPDAADFYRSVLRALLKAGVPFLVGGAYAFAFYTKIERHTKDLDVFVSADDVDRAMAVLEGENCRTARAHPHWLAKAQRGDLSIDLIYATGNGLYRVDASWWSGAVERTVLDVRVRLCPPEEMLCTKAFIMERERFDGADFAHLLAACADDMNWRRLLDLFGPHWRVLYSHLILFGYIYPSRRHLIPANLLGTLAERLELEQAAPPMEADLCRGTLLSRAQYLFDVEQGFLDARLEPFGSMTEREIEQWTQSIEKDGPGTKAGFDATNGPDAKAPPG